MRLFGKSALILVILAALAIPCYGADYPTKPIKLYVPFSAGGDTDIVARTIASLAEKKLGVPIAVENKPGATGTLCIGEIAKAKPDGYEISVVATSAIARTPHILTLPYDPQKDFTYICKLALYANGVMVPVAKPWKNFKDIVAYAKANPGKVSYAVPGALEAGYIAMAFVAKQDGLKWKRVPFKGASEAMASVLGGHNDFFAGGGMGASLKLVEAGKFRAMAIFSPERFDRLPKVPTLMEMGYNFAIRSGLGILAPAGLDSAIQKKLEKAFLDASKEKTFVDLLNRLALPADRKSGPDFKKDAAAEYKELGAVLADMGIKKKK